MKLKSKKYYDYITSLTRYTLHVNCAGNAYIRNSVIYSNYCNIIIAHPICTTTLSIMRIDNILFLLFFAVRMENLEYYRNTNSYGRF